MVQTIYDLRPFSEAFARFRLPMRVMTGGIGVVFGGIGVFTLLYNSGSVLHVGTISDAHYVTLTTATAVCLVLGVLGVWVSLWGLRRVAVSVSCNQDGVSFVYSGGRTRRIPWRTSGSRFNIRDWRLSAHRRNLPDSFALSACWGPWILAILSPEAFEGIMACASSSGLRTQRGGVNIWLTGSPRSTVVYTFLDAGQT